MPSCPSEDDTVSNQLASIRNMATLKDLDNNLINPDANDFWNEFALTGAETLFEHGQHETKPPTQEVLPLTMATEDGGEYVLGDTESDDVPFTLEEPEHAEGSSMHTKSRQPPAKVLSLTWDAMKFRQF